MLETVFHQGFAQRLVQQAVARDRVPHAYLFHGPDGVGKERLALGLAQRLLCADPVVRPVPLEHRTEVGIEHLHGGCGTCEDCRLVRAGTHPDLHLVYRQLSREHPDPEVRRRKALDIGVDVLRHFVIERVSLTPQRGRAKVFILREADRITPQAQNALLKTLEEPPGTTFLILLVASPDRLLPTTRSRCQNVRFDPLPDAFVASRIKADRPELAPSAAAWYTAWGAGSLGRAMEAIDDELYEINGTVIQAMRNILRSAASRGSSRRRPQAEGGHGPLTETWSEAGKRIGEGWRRRDPDITDTEATRRGFQTVFRMAALWWSDVLRAQSGWEGRIANEDDRAGIAATAERMNAERIADIVQRFAQAEGQLDRNANTQLVLETLVNDLGRAARNLPLLAFATSGD